MTRLVRALVVGALAFGLCMVAANLLLPIGDVSSPATWLTAGTVGALAGLAHYFAKREP